jgi:hypothetical protein
MTEDDAMAEEKEEEEEETDEEGQASLERLRGGAPSGMWATHVGTSAETLLRPGTEEEEAWQVQGARGGKAPQVVATPAASTKEEVHIVLPPAAARPKTAAAMHTLSQEAMPPPPMQRTNMVVVKVEAASSNRYGSLAEEEDEEEEDADEDEEEDGMDEDAGGGDRKPAAQPSAKGSEVEGEETRALLTQEDGVRLELSPVDEDAVDDASVDPMERPLAEGDEGPEGLTLVDARNGFNELNRFGMLWSVRHLWPQGAQFAFNCYRHSAQLIVRTPAGKARKILSSEGVTQGDPLSMVLYGVALLPLIKRLREKHPDVVQPWYADDAAMWGKARRNAKLLRLLVEEGPAAGYFPEPEKSWHICRKEDMPAARQAFEEEGFPDMQFSEGRRYVGGHVGTLEKEVAWIRPQVAKWAAAVEKLAEIALRYPQTAYAGLAMSLQGEWQYLLRTVPGAGALMGPIEKAIREVFLPALFGEPDAGGCITDDEREMYGLSVRHTGLGIPNPCTTGDQCLDMSESCCSMLTASIREGEDLVYGEHTKHVKNIRVVKKGEKDGKNEAIVGRWINDRRLAMKVRNRLKRNKRNGGWLTCIPNALNGTRLTREEFRDNLRLRYGFDPLDLRSKCDGCDCKLTVEHALSCKKGGLVLIRHNSAAGEWGNMCAKALLPSAVTHEPYIKYGGSMQERNRRAAKLRDEARARRASGAEEPPGEAEADVDEDETPLGDESQGDKGCDGFWLDNWMTIFDMRITQTDAPSYRGGDPLLILKRAEATKKKKYLTACLDERKHFTPLVYSVDGVAGPETRGAEKRLAFHLAKKWNREYSEMCGYVRTRMSIAVVRSNTLLLRGQRKGRGVIQRPVHEDGAGVSLQGYWQE